MPQYISIPLGKDEYALIDAEDAALVLESGFRFRATIPPRPHYTKYARGSRFVDGKREEEYLHRLIMKPPLGFEIDHIDRNGLDCRRHNMRVVTHSENCMNRRRPRPPRQGRSLISHRIQVKVPKSGYRGVVKGIESKTRGTRWTARINHGYLGTFATAEEAARAYDKESRALYGEQAVLNFPEEVL